MHAQHGMHINYIVETAFGNFQPINAVLIEVGDAFLAVPKNWSPPHIELAHAREFLEVHATPDSLVHLGVLRNRPAAHPVLLSVILATK